MVNEYEKAIAGSFNWPKASEEERYGIWTLHLKRGGKFLDYSEFCDTMDKATA